MLFEPVPAMIGTRLLAICTENSIISFFSSVLNVALSPVVPQISRASTPSKI